MHNSHELLLHASRSTPSAYIARDLRYVLDVQQLNGLLAHALRSFFEVKLLRNRQQEAVIASRLSVRNERLEGLFERLTERLGGMYPVDELIVSPQSFCAAFFE